MDESCNMTKKYGEGSRQQRHMSICMVCGITEQSLPVSWNRKIFQMEAFSGKSCFHITHSTACAGLFLPRIGMNNLTLRKGKTVKKQCYRISTSHAIYRTLMEEYGLGSKLDWKRRRNEDKETSDNSNVDEELNGEDEDVFDDCIDKED